MTTHRIEFEYPDDLLRTRKDAELQRIAREAFYIRLYQQGAISSGQAGAQLGMSRVAFLDLLGAYGVSYFDEGADLAEDLHNADIMRS